MDNKKFLDELEKVCDKFGADVYIKLENSKGSPMGPSPVNNISENVLKNCKLTSVTIIPVIKQIKEEVQDGETSIHSSPGEVR